MMKKQSEAFEISIFFPVQQSFIFVKCQLMSVQKGHLNVSNLTITLIVSCLDLWINQS